VALELQATGSMKSFEAKPPDLATLEVGSKGAAHVCSRRRARLAVKCRGGTFMLPVPRRRLCNKVVSSRCMACPSSCSLRPGLRFVVVAPPSRSAASGGSLQSAWCKDVEALCSHVGYRE
jgi:hypothetical protein